MPELSPIGEIVHGGVLCLVCEGGTRSAAEGRDLAAVCRGLSIDRLDFWLERYRRGGSMSYECGIIQAEIDRRDPRHARGTLWEFTGAASSGCA